MGGERDAARGGAGTDPGAPRAAGSAPVATRTHPGPEGAKGSCRLAQGPDGDHPPQGGGSKSLTRRSASLPCAEVSNAPKRTGRRCVTVSCGRGHSTAEIHTCRWVCSLVVLAYSQSAHGNPARKGARRGPALLHANTCVKIVLMPTRKLSVHEQAHGRSVLFISASELQGHSIVKHCALQTQESCFIVAQGPKARAGA